jgi:hypothetical protein
VKGFRIFDRPLEMSIAPPVKVPNISPFLAILQDGADRLLDFVKTEGFTFVVKGEEFESTLSEALLLSAKVSAILESNPMIRRFELTSDSIESINFHSFIEFVRSHDSIVFPVSHAQSFLSISEELCNSRLTGIFLSSVQSGRGEFSDASFLDSSLDECASQFFGVLLGALRCLDRRTLHRLLSSTSLRIENEDSLLRLLVDLEVDHYCLSNIWKLIFIRGRAFRFFLMN